LKVDAGKCQVMKKIDKTYTRRITLITREVEQQQVIVSTKIIWSRRKVILMQGSDGILCHHTI